MLAQSRQSESVKWRDVRKTEFHPGQCTIIVHGAFAQQIAVFCTPDNYPVVEAFLISKLPGVAASRGSTSGG